MTVFDHPLWPRLKPHARFTERRGNLELLQLPDDLRAAALLTHLPCVACGADVYVFRARRKSKRSRIAGSAEERRLFYAATCPASANSGCARSKAAKSHKIFVRQVLGDRREVSRVVVLRMLDGSGAVLGEFRSALREKVRVEILSAAREIEMEVVDGQV